MKQTGLTVCAMIVAGAALGHSVWMQMRTEKLIDEALRRREAEFVTRAAPGVAKVAEDMLGEGFKPADFKPRTLEELWTPFVVIVQRLNQGGEPAK